MKKLPLLLFVLAIGFQSCQQEDILENSQKDTAPEQPGGLAYQTPNNGQGHAALIIDGEAFYAGIGYSPTQDRLFAPAIDRFDMLQSTAIPKPLEVDVALVKNNEDLEKFVRKTYSRRTGGLLAKVFGFGRNVKRVIEERTTINKNTVSVVARISVQKYRYLVAGDPFLDSRAQQLVNQGRLGDFLKKYGPSYVDEQVTGGDVYYVYTYNLNKVALQKRTNFERNIVGYVQGWFGLPADVVLSNDDRRVISNSVEKYTVATNIVGFTPNLVNNTGQLNGELNRVNAYLAQNPTNAAAMEMSIASYANVFANTGLTNQFNQHLKCYQDWEKWTELQAKVDFVYHNTTSGTLRQQALQARNAINAQLAKSRDCNGSTTPNLNQYNSMLETYRVEQRRRDIQTARTNMTIKNPGTCTQDITFSLMAYQIEGSIPLYQFTHRANSHIVQYTTNPDPSHLTNFNQSIAGYVFPSPEHGSITLNFFLRVHTGAGNLSCQAYVITPPWGGTVFPIGQVFPKK